MSQPTLTIYRTGLVNLNGEATRLLPSYAAGVQLLPPTTPGTYWHLVPRRNLDGAFTLCGRPDRGNVRFRAASFAAALFAALPPHYSEALYMGLEPLELGFRLVAREHMLHNPVQQ